MLSVVVPGGRVPVFRRPDLLHAGASRAADTCRSCLRTRAGIPEPVRS
jgi:hypothetical protein